MDFTRYDFLFTDDDGLTRHATCGVNDRGFFNSLEDALYVLWELTLADRKNAWKDGVSATVSYCNIDFYTVTVDRVKHIVTITWKERHD